MRKRKEETIYWNYRIRAMIGHDVDTTLVKNRQRSIRWLLKEKYNDVTSTIEKERLLNFIYEVLYLDRKMRLWTEGLEQPLKERLSDEYIVENLQ